MSRSIINTLKTNTPSFFASDFRRYLVVLSHELSGFWTLSERIVKAIS